MVKRKAENQAQSPASQEVGRQAAKTVAHQQSVMSSVVPPQRSLPWSPQGQSWATSSHRCLEAGAGREGTDTLPLSQVLSFSLPFSLTLSKKCNRFYLFISQSWRQREIFHPLFHSPDGCNCQGWAKLKLGTSNSIQVSPDMGAGAQMPGPSPIIFPRCNSRELD